MRDTFTRASRKFAYLAAASLLTACALQPPAAAPAPPSSAASSPSPAAAAALTRDGQELLAAWPTRAPPPAQADIEARAARILASMNLRQKVGQMTQAEIKSITPGEVRQYYIGSVLNGGGSWPGKNKHAAQADWLKLAEDYYQASMSSDAAMPVPVIWGTDAVHGHNNVFGATLFPQNIGLGAMHDPELIGEIGTAVARAVRSTGIQWVFAPALPVVQNPRWGRTYEGFSEQPALVREYAQSYVSGLQAALGDDGSAVATAKHFLGDGGTAGGVDQGVTRVTAAQLAEVHGAGYLGALSANVQTVMASYSSWFDTGNGVDHGRMHGDRLLLTGLLKERLGFDGFVVSDWNAIGQLPGCTNASCAAAINAGIDMVMVPDDWQAFIDNTVRQVEQGTIPMSRIDDAVTRILRVKLRAGLFAHGPADNRYAGQPAYLQPRALARRAVRESLVLLKNAEHVLPLATTAHVLVVGAGADSFARQNGGWTLSWQGDNNSNADFPVGDTLLGGLRAALAAGKVDYSADGQGVDFGQYSAVIAVLAEQPYAEKAGDIPPGDDLSFSRRYPDEAALLARVSGHGVPVVTVLLTGRPAYTNDLINRSSAFVVAWLPGTEGAGVADLLVRSSASGAPRDFTGRLAYSWPATPCADAPALFAPGFGLRFSSAAPATNLPEPAVGGHCAVN